VFNPNREELAWAAGFFDGEGSIHLGKNDPGKHRRCPKMSIGQSGETAPILLKRFQDAVGGLGSIGGPYGPYPNQKSFNRLSTYKWGAGGFPSVQAACAMLWPFLGPVKRDAIKRVFVEYKEEL
jgi:hypothetical protein